MGTSSKMNSDGSEPVSKKSRIDLSTVSVPPIKSHFMAWCVVRHISNLEKAKEAQVAFEQLVCTRSVCSTATEPCQCSACSRSTDSSGHVQVTPGPVSAQLEPTTCPKCGHESASGLCCSSEQQPSKRCRLADDAARVCGRAGERRRQDRNREVEAASLRPREILAVAQARTPAQLTLARMRERISKK